MANVHAVDLALLVFRVAIGAVFIAHGVNHIIGGGKMRQRVAFDVAGRRGLRD